MTDTTNTTPATGTWEWLSVKEVASRIGVSEGVIRKMSEKGKLRCYRAGKQFKFVWHQVLEDMAKDSQSYFLKRKAL